MLRDFISKGHPRPGQWVKVKVGDETFLAIVLDADHGCFGTRVSPLLKGEVEIVSLPSGLEIRANRALPDSDPKKRRGRPGWYGVSVCVLGGRDKAFDVLVEGDRLTPIVSRSEFPPSMLKNEKGEDKMDPRFVPIP